MSRLSSLLLTLGYRCPDIRITLVLFTLIYSERSFCRRFHSSLSSVQPVKVKIMTRLNTTGRQERQWFSWRVPKTWTWLSDETTIIAILPILWDRCSGTRTALACLHSSSSSYVPTRTVLCRNFCSLPSSVLQTWFFILSLASFLLGLVQWISTRLLFLLTWCNLKPLCFSDLGNRQNHGETRQNI